ncbi:MAG: hypothetical protein MZV63_46835 [Marinilabiliales bacterium]|nr:hypothetical protein [Marinilabiliales bacterium]
MSFVVLGQSNDVPVPVTRRQAALFRLGQPLEKDGEGGKENIWVMDRAGSGWGEPRPLPPVINSLEAPLARFPRISGNLYFGGTREGEGFGLSDIFWSKFGENGTLRQARKPGGGSQRARL